MIQTYFLYAMRVTFKHNFLFLIYMPCLNIEELISEPSTKRYFFCVFEKGLCCYFLNLENVYM